MEKVGEAQVGLGLAGDLALFARLPFARYEGGVLGGCEVVAEVLGDVARFGEDEGFGGGGGGDGYDGGFAEGVNLLEGDWGEHVFAVVDFDSVGEFELFEEPGYALGAGFVEPAWERCSVSRGEDGYVVGLMRRRGGLNQ